MYTKRSSFGVHTAHVGGLLSAGGSASAAAVSDSANTAAAATLTGIHRLRYCMVFSSGNASTKAAPTRSDHTRARLFHISARQQSRDWRRLQVVGSDSKQHQ